MKYMVLITYILFNIHFSIQCETLNHAWYTNKHSKCEFIHSSEMLSLKFHPHTITPPLTLNINEIRNLTIIIKQTFDIRSQSPLFKSSTLIPLLYCKESLVDHPLELTTTTLVNWATYFSPKSQGIRHISFCNLIFISTFPFKVNRVLILDMRTELDQYIV